MGCDLEVEITSGSLKPFSILQFLLPLRYKTSSPLSRRQLLSDYNLDNQQCDKSFLL